MITDFQDIPSHGRMKAYILSLIRPKIKSTFGIHDPFRSPISIPVESALESTKKT